MMNNGVNYTMCYNIGCSFCPLIQPASSCTTTGAVSGVVTGVIASILTGTVTAIVMYFIMRGKTTDKYKMGNNEAERVYEDPSYANQSAKDSVEMTSNPAYEKVVM